MAEVWRCRVKRCGSAVATTKRSELREGGREFQLALLEGEREEEISRLEVVEREEQRSDFLSEQVQYIPTVQYRQDDGNMAKRACVC